MKAESSQPTDGPSARSSSCESRLHPRWVAPASMIITALAVADSAYLTYAHFTTPNVLYCSTKGFIDCAAVTTSSYSHPFGIPVALVGLVWSVAMLALCTPWAWREASPWLGWVRLVGTISGVPMVLYLLWAELIKLHHICEFCTIMQVLSVALFFVVVFGTAAALPAAAAESEPDETS